MDHFEIGRALVIILAGVLFMISVLALKRKRDERMLLMCAIFGILFAKGILLTVGMVDDEVENIVSELWFHLTFDVLILLFLFFSFLRVPKKEIKVEKKLSKKIKKNRYWR